MCSWLCSWLYSWCRLPVLELFDELVEAIQSCFPHLPARGDPVVHDLQPFRRDLVRAHASTLLRCHESAPFEDGQMLHERGKLHLERRRQFAHGAPPPLREARGRPAEYHSCDADSAYGAYRPDGERLSRRQAMVVQKLMRGRASLDQRSAACLRDHVQQTAHSVTPISLRGLCG